MRTKALLCVVLVFVFACAVGVAQATDPAVERVFEEAQKPSALEKNLHQLTDEIGGRVPGSPAMTKALAWGVAAMQAAGGENVHTEKFTLAHSWAEGATSLTVVAPGHFPVRAVSFGWGPVLAPVKNVAVVDLGNATAADFAKEGNIAGKAILVHSEPMKTWEDLFAEYQRTPDIVDAAVKGKARLILVQSTRERDLLYRHINTNNAKPDKIPMLMVAREDAARMARLLAGGQAVAADVSIPNRIGGPLETANVVGEIRGSEKPDEFVVIGAHLDSWELGTGALDNGCNAALVVDALRAIKASGVRPRRSMRFVLFSGEEQGMLGSFAYVRAHRKELDGAVGVVIVDSGTGRITGFSLGGRKDLVDASAELMAPFQAWDAATLTTNADAGTDNFDFLLEGVPTFVANQEEANYLINYHAMSDTYDKVDFANLKRHVAEAATLGFELANRTERFGRRLSKAEILQTLVDTGLDKDLKRMGYWPDWESGKRGRQP